MLLMLMLSAHASALATPTTLVVDLRAPGTPRDASARAATARRVVSLTQLYPTLLAAADAGACKAGLTFAQQRLVMADGEHNLALCADNGDCAGTQNGVCRAQGTCSGGSHEGQPCHFDTDCPRDPSTLHHFCAPDYATLRATGPSWSAPADLCDGLYNQQATTYTPELKLRMPSVKDGMKGVLNLRIVDTEMQSVTVLQ